MPTEPVETLDFSTKTSSVTPEPTETIQWFPPTKTPQPLVTRTIKPTADLRPGIGSILLEDDFSNADDWQTFQSETGSAAVGNQQLSLVVSTPKGALSSLRSMPVPDDFYLEITASANLCRETDAYGLILRAADQQTYYRFVISCNGMTRFEQVRNGSLSLLTDWTPSGQIPIGVPARLRLGVWAYGDEVRLFIGDVHQFSMPNLLFSGGQIGVFARSDGNNAVSISFSNLVVSSLGEVPPTQTPTPSNTATP